MSTVLKRFSLVGVAVALMAATGCGTGPAKAGSAAIIGGQAISLGAVQERAVRWLNTKQGAREARDAGEFKYEQLSRALLADEIEHKIAENAAKRENITVDETKVYDVVQQSGGTAAADSAPGIHDGTNIHRFTRDALIRSELARRNISTLSITIDFLFAKDLKEAREKAQQVAADPAKMAEFIEAAPRSTSGASQAGANRKVRVTESPQLATTPLFAAAPGTVVAFQPNEQQALSMVALVKERNTLPPVPGEDDLADRIDPKALSDFGGRIAQFLAADLAIEINPRYGVWDPVTPTVAPSEGERKGFMAPVAKKNKS